MAYCGEAVWAHHTVWPKINETARPQSGANRWYPQTNPERNRNRTDLCLVYIVFVCDWGCPR